jgi:hypothetical protein
LKNYKKLNWIILVGDYEEVLSVSKGKQAESVYWIYELSAF